jgi:hypothetical protein
MSSAPLSLGIRRAFREGIVASSEKPGTVRATLGEMKRGTWIADAQRRSSRRKSPWNLLLVLIIPLWIFLWLKTLAILWNVALMAKGAAVPHGVVGWLDLHFLGNHSMSLAGALFLFAPFITTLASSMVLGNFLIYLIPPARRAMDNEDKAFPGTEYFTAQKTMGRIALYTSPGIVLSFLGAYLEVAR